MPASTQDREPYLVTARPDLLLIADKGLASKDFVTGPAFQGFELLPPSFNREQCRASESLLKPVQQLIEPVNDTFKGRRDLEAHRARAFEGVAVRVARRMRAMTSAIWHNHMTGGPVLRSLTAFDH